MSIFYKLGRKKRSDLYIDTEELPVMIVYVFKGKRFSFTTGVRVKIKDWDEDWRKKRTNEPILPSDKDFKVKNTLLLQEWKGLKDIIYELRKSDKIPSAELVKSHHRNKVVIRKTVSSKEILFEILFDKYAKWVGSSDYFIETRNSVSYVRSLIGSIKDIQRYTKEHQVKVGYKLLPPDIDKDFTNGLVKYCDGRGLQPSTIQKRLKTLVSFTKWLEENHSIRLVVPKPKRTQERDKEIVWFTNDEIIKLWEFKDFDISNPDHELNFLKNDKPIEYLYSKGKPNPKTNEQKEIKFTTYEVYKDMILFLCGTGLRYIDMVNLNIENFRELEKRDKSKKKGEFIKGEFVLVPQKTGRTVRIPNTPLTWEIYKKYSSGRAVGMKLFPKTKFGNIVPNQKFNKHIKEICRIVGLNRPIQKPVYDWNNKVVDGTDRTYQLWEVVTSHIGRRTMIRTYIDVGYDRRTLMSITGHKNYKTLDVYYESTEQDRFKFNNLLHTNLVQKKSEEPELDEKDKLFQLYKEGHLSWEQLGHLLNK